MPAKKKEELGESESKLKAKYAAKRAKLAQARAAKEAEAKRQSQVKSLVREQLTSLDKAQKGKSAGFKQSSAAKRKAPGIATSSTPATGSLDADATTGRSHADERPAKRPAPLPDVVGHAPGGRLPLQDMSSGSTGGVLAGAIAKKRNDTNEYPLTIFIGDLFSGAAKPDVIAEFKRFGEIDEVRIVHTKNIAFVKFATEEACVKAIATMDGEFFRGSRLRVSRATMSGGGAGQSRNSGGQSRDDRAGNDGAGDNGGSDPTKKPDFRHYDDVNDGVLPSNPQAQPVREGFRAEYARLGNEAGPSRQARDRGRQLISYDDL